ncbi:hypothetical protein WISP_104272 [Willisornis vidua]|uniref:Rna-directed dna polymerase from mobile element jockey-like n=1 Tax=Willisornis vidua TaxID=1566151 RepID=A0ABQ9D2U9_9PASS|nr:hypothetical protein WISP_104272 [Willisornis vidua]
MDFILRQFEDDTKLGRNVDLQRDLDRLDRWVKANSMTIVPEMAKEAEKKRGVKWVIHLEYSELEGTRKDHRVQLLNEWPYGDRIRDLGVIRTMF